MCIVSGEANFQMKRTALTVGGFTQPVVAKGLIEQSQSVEKGLVQRFLWISPKPSYSSYAELQPANDKFSDYLGIYCILHTHTVKMCFMLILFIVNRLFKLAQARQLLRLTISPNHCR